MKRVTTLISILLLAASALPASAQSNESWRDRSPYEITAGINIGTREFQYDGYEFGSEQDNLLTTNTLQTPSFNFGFTYKLNRRITLGAITTYTQSNFVKTTTYDNSIARDDRYKYMSIAPRIRFDWVNNKNVTLYSSFALGVGFVSEHEQQSNRAKSYTTGYIEATYIGIKVGRTLFGFADLSSSSTGAMRIGMGYNFKSKK